MVGLKERQRFLGRLLTVPDKPGRPRPMACKRYLLRGIATEKDIMYVCQRQQLDLIDLDDAPKKNLDQWWRLAYAQGEEHPVKAEVRFTCYMPRHIRQINSIHRKLRLSGS